MADVKISAATDIGTVAATDMLPVARPGSATAYHATMAEIGVFASTNLPVATTSTLGVVRADGSTITISGGTISSVVGPPSTAAPLMDGTANAGTLNAWSRGDHVHPTDTSRYAASNPSGFQTAAQVTSTLAAYAPLASPALTGNPTAPTPAPSDNDTSIATTAFVTNAVNGVAPGVSSFNSRTGVVTLTSGDVTTALTFAPAPLNAPVFTGDARAVTPAAGDADTSIATTAFVAAAVAPAENNAGRNLIHNALFTVAQRGAGPFTANQVYTLDRWMLLFNLDTGVSVQQLNATDAIRAAIGDESVAYYMSVAFTGNAGAASYTEMMHRVENSRRLSGKTVTLSFWAWCNAGALQLSLSAGNSYGTGGSPSAPDAVTPIISPVVMSTTPTRYSRTFTLPSAAGRTFGTNGDANTYLQFWMSAGTTNGPPGAVIQSGTINLWGVQLEVGTVATPLDYGGSPQQQLAQCQRFYQVGYIAMAAYGAAASGINYAYPFPVVMRATPSIAFSGTTYTNASGIGVTGSTNYVAVIGATTTATAASGFTSNFTASADL